MSIGLSTGRNAPGNRPGSWPRHAGGLCAVRPRRAGRDDRIRPVSTTPGAAAAHGGTRSRRRYWAEPRSTASKAGASGLPVADRDLRAGRQPIVPGLGLREVRAQNIEVEAFAGRHRCQLRRGPLVVVRLRDPLDRPEKQVAEAPEPLTRELRREGDVHDRVILNVASCRMALKASTLFMLQCSIK